LACVTKEARSERIFLRCSANIGCLRRTTASRDKQPVVARIDRTQEIMQAVEGWKCVSRPERMAFWRSESACRRETIIDGQYPSTLDTMDSLADCRCPFPLGVARFGDDGLDQVLEVACLMRGDWMKSS
jgi:hypothetical protein